MTENVKKSFDIFKDLDDQEKCPILNNYEVGKHCDTKFKYKLDEYGFNVAKVGIQDFLTCIPINMTFLPQIKLVTIIDQT